MTTYIIRRLLAGLLVVIMVSLLVFLVMRILPGDSLALYISKNELGNLKPEQIEELRHKFGLDESLPMQYVNWVKGLVNGNLGISMYYDLRVEILIKQRLPVTMYLGALSLIISGILGVAAGVVCAVRRGKWIDTLVTFLANIGITVPSFWVGIILIYLLALKAQWLPVYGYTSPFTDFWLSTRQLIMPVICLALFPIASLCRQTRAAMLEVMQKDYIRTAWAKGLKERTVIMKHTIKNAMIPVITAVGLHVGVFFGGSVVIEQIFSIPGIGRLMAQSLFQQDFQVVQSGTLIIAVFVVVTNLLVDISYGWLDPTIRYY
jgi:peptide/nickel transport system permease protein